MRILLTGASGQVGWELARSLMPLGEVIVPARERCDLARPETLAALVAETGPTAIVNAAAYTAVDRAESEEALARRINAEAVAELAAAARRAGALLVHYSTDYVFDGSKPAAYVEDDPVAPLNAYGRSKLAGEQAIAASGCDHLIFRTTWVYAARGANFLLTMLRLGAERDVLRVVADQFGAPTWARNIADASALALAQAVRERAAGHFRSGLFHLAGGGETSWHGFAEEIFAQVRARRPDLALRVGAVEAIPSTAYPTPAARPLNSRLDQRAVAERFGIVMPCWRAALGRCLDELGGGRR
ncbi:dTDP-4-dehydrorhamnose reductase [Pseudothauera lacus]|uniref:dTDP-4-dehydrorhamnose reductase n=1 Tax=Pseudothauera lacus TaxID=2136175 RepID=A0A2T4IDS9_9RHOO|nr:dTDP-4-dehydrorhamnose reductase [Pseudothauera lacus]PTD95920.1 dTDP-4-dehydrorhamnose reductase [Pseudothauera lacus]